MPLQEESGGPSRWIASQKSTRREDSSVENGLREDSVKNTKLQCSCSVGKLVFAQVLQKIPKRSLQSLRSCLREESED